jgi:general secretion pathway protein F
MELSVFQYLVLDSKGRRREVSIEAFSSANARSRLAAKGMIPLKELQKNSDFHKSGRKWLPVTGKFNATIFTDRLAPLLLANVPLERALAVLEEGTTDKQMLAVIFDLRKGLHEGKRFSSLIRQQGSLFPPMYASLVESGEEAGCLPEVMDELRKFLAESKSFKDFVITSSIYPVIVLLVTLGVTVLLFTVFIPRFAKIFADMGRELPALTQTLVDISGIMVKLWWLLPLAVAVLFFLNRFYRKGSFWQRFKDRLWLKVPLAGKLAVSIQVSTFLQALAIMVKKNVHLLQAVRIARKTLSNSVIAESFTGIEEQLREGAKLSITLGKSSYMPPGSMAMLKIAEESGDVGEMLDRITREEQTATRNLVKKILALLEPAIIVMLALVVMLVVFAIFTAIWEMNSIR